MAVGVVLMSRWAPPVMEARESAEAALDPGKVVLEGF
jgi:hypothetical protein